MQITPLRFERIAYYTTESYINDRHAGKRCVYGTGRYKSATGLFMIERHADKWCVGMCSVPGYTAGLFNTFLQSGLQHIYFDRRRDAVAALEAFVSGMDAV